MESSPLEFKNTTAITTPSGTYEVHYGGRVVPTADIPHDHAGVARGCKEGCPRYGKRYSCPPHAPSFEALSRGYEYISIYYLQMYVAQLPMEKLFHKIRTASTMLTARMNRGVRKLEEQNPDTRMLSCSLCHLCRACTAPSGEPCAKPKKLRYSLQSTGVNVSKIMDDLFGIPINWTWTGEFRYSIVVGGLLQKKQQLPVLEVEREMKK